MRVNDKFGQLANRLWGFSNFLAYGYEHKISILNPGFLEFATAFRGSSNQFVPACQVTAINHWVSTCAVVQPISIKLASRVLDYLRHHQSLCWPISHLYIDADEHINLDTEEKLGRSGITLVGGWNFRCPQLMLKHRNQIVEYFALNDRYLRPVEQAFEKAASGGKPVFGIHVRRGDYEQFEGGRYFYPIDRYVELMRSIAERMPTAFIVCSDEKIDRNIFGDMDVTFGPGSPVGDLYTLGHCDRILGPPSTFSHWASYYGDKPLHFIYPEHHSIDDVEGFPEISVSTA